MYRSLLDDRPLRTLALWVLAPMILALSPLSAAAADGGELFARNCTACHGKDGKGQTIMGQKWGIKDLAISKLPETEVRQQIKEGKEDASKGSKMPSFKDKLTDEEIKALATFIMEMRK